MKTKTTAFLPPLGLGLTPPKSRSSMPKVPANMTNNQYKELVGELTSHMIKQAGSIFPNADPNFFIASFRQSDREKRVDRPYANNVWVYSAISAISTNLITLPKVLDVVATEEKELISENPILKVLSNPNPLMDGPTFWENVILDLMLPTSKTKGGQCFILTESLTDERVNLRRGDIPVELFPFNDEFMTPIIDKEDGMTLMGWEFKPSASRPAIIYKPEEVIRLFLVDPDHPLRGQAPVWATRSGLRQDLKAQTLNERFFDNNASLGGVLETDAELQEETGRELRESFEERYAGQENAGRVALLHSGVTYKMFQQTHQDMQFIEQRKWSREEILAAYGVPKFNIGVYEDINFATAKAADKSFWQNTLVPLDQRILRGFTDQWVKFVDRQQFRLESDYTKVMALAPDLTEKLDQAKKLFEMQVPLAEINNRLELQLNIKDFAWLKTSLVQGSLVNAEQLTGESAHLPEEEGMEPTSALPPKEEEEEEPVEAAIKRIGNMAREDEAFENLKKGYVEDILKPDEKRFNKLINTYLREQRNLILDEVDKWENSQKSIKAEEDFNKPDPKKLTNFKSKENKRLLKTTSPEYIKMVEKEASVIDIELDGLGPWEVNSPTMRKILKERLKQVKEINTTTFKFARGAISRATEEAVKEGLGVKATAKLIKKEVNKVYKGRILSDTIARTETGSIHSQTRNDIYKVNGINKIKWLTFKDKKVRGKDASFSHQVLDGAVVKLEEGFNNGEKIMYPLDPNASAANVINCRCFVTSQA